MAIRVLGVFSQENLWPNFVLHDVAYEITCCYVFTFS